MPTSRRISVALCTFNGEAYLSEQLESLRNQSRLPDELIVYDDGSADRTVQILQEFSCSSPFPVLIHQNEKTIGPAQNFGLAIAACSGEIISLCDQDDISDPEKLAATAATFDRQPDLAFVFSDAEICGADGKPLGYRLWESVGFAGNLYRRFDAGDAFDVLLRQNVVTGATLSFATRYRSLILPIGRGWMHDGWIALLLSAIAKGKAIDQPLLRYRQHPNQSVGAERRSMYQQYHNAKAMDRNVFAEQADRYAGAMDRLQKNSDAMPSAKVIHHLQEKIKHCRKRSAIRQGQSGRILPALGELITQRYDRFSLGWKSFAQDLFL